MPKLTLCVDITGRKIELARVIKKLGNGLLETDGRSEDVTQSAVCCVMELMARHCEREERGSLTYEIEGKGSLTYTPSKSHGGADGYIMLCSECWERPAEPLEDSAHAR